jgi:hypothetical protein
MSGRSSGWDRWGMRLVWLSGVLCAAVFLATVPLPRADNHLLGSDGLSYYSILRSVVLDGDLDFTNDYRLLGVAPQPLTPKGLPGNPFAIGAAVLWLPFFLLAHLCSLTLQALGCGVPATGVGPLYEAAVCLGTILYATAGFALTYGCCRRLSEARPALLATLTMWWATQAIYYVVAEPSMSHGLTIFTSALFFSLWLGLTPRSGSGQALALGLAAALAALVRWQDSVLLLLPLGLWAAWTLDRRMSVPDALIGAGTFLAAFAVGLMPQLWMWHGLYGQALLIPQGNEWMEWGRPYILQTLFSTRHGLISWHPVYLLALLGIPFLWRRHRRAAVGAALGFVLFVYVNGAVSQWWAGDAFGGRRCTSLVPPLTFPLAALLNRTKPGRSFRLLVAVLGGLVLWNGLAFAQYRLGFVSMSEALTWRQMTVDRLLLPWRLLQRVLH